MLIAYKATAHTVFGTSNRVPDDPRNITRGTCSGLRGYFLSSVRKQVRMVHRISFHQNRQQALISTVAAKNSSSSAALSILLSHSPLLSRERKKSVFYPNNNSLQSSRLFFNEQHAERNCSFYGYSPSCVKLISAKTIT